MSRQSVELELQLQRERDGRCGSCGIDTHENVAVGGKLVKKGLTIENEMHRGRCLFCIPFSGSEHTPTSPQENSHREVENSSRGRTSLANGGETKRGGSVPSSPRSIAQVTAQSPASHSRQALSPASDRQSCGSRVLSLTVAEGANRIELDGSMSQQRVPGSITATGRVPHAEQGCDRQQGISSDSDNNRGAGLTSKKRTSSEGIASSSKRTKPLTTMESTVKDILTRAKANLLSHKVQDKCMENLRVKVESEKDEDEKRKWIHTINEYGGLEVVLDAMKTHKTKSSVKYEACKMLDLLGWAGEDANVDRRGGIVAVLDVLKSGPGAKLAAAGLEALVNLSTTPHIRDKIIEEDGLVAATSIMKKHPHNTDVQVEGCKLILNLSSGGIKENAAKIAGAGVIPLVIAAMKNHENDDVITETSCEALQNLSVTDLARHEITKAGGIRVILELMETEVEDMQGDVLDLLGNLTSDTIPVQAQVVSEGGVEKLLGMMKEFPANQLLLEKACTALSNLVAGKEGCKHFLQNDGVWRVTEAMKNNEKSGTLQDEACLLLSSMKRTPAWNEQIQRKEVRGTLQKAAKLFPEKCKDTVVEIEKALRSKRR